MLTPKCLFGAIVLNRPINAGADSVENAELLADHYQKTYELTFELWKQRNMTFLLLLAVIGAATLLTFGSAQTNPLLIDWIAKVLGISEACPPEKTSEEADFGRSFRSGSRTRDCASPRVLRHKVSLRRAGLQKTQSVPFENAQNIKSPLSSEGATSKLFSYPGAVHGFLGEHASNVKARFDSNLVPFRGSKEICRTR
jgi:hypothetical protein